MKNKIIVNLMLIILILSFTYTISYGKYIGSDGKSYSENFNLFEWSYRKDEFKEGIKKDLAETFGYTEDPIKNKILINTFILNNGPLPYYGGDQYYSVDIGSGHMVKTVTSTELKRKYGADELNKNFIRRGTRWSVQYLIELDINEQNGIMTVCGVVNTVYGNKDVGKKSSDKENFLNGAEDINNGGLLEWLDNASHTVNRALSKIDKIIDEFKSDFIGTLVKWFCRFIRFLGDMLQSLLDKIKSEEVGVPKNLFSVTYSYRKLKGVKFEKMSPNTIKNCDYSKLNEYTRVTKNKDSSKVKEVSDARDWQKKIYVDNEKDDFSVIEDYSNLNEDGEDEEEENEIPVILSDLYGVSLNNTDIFDINFFVTTRNKNTAWRTIRNFFTIIIRMEIILVLASLIGILIYNGIKISAGSISLTPMQRANHIDGIQRFAKALAYTFGIVLFMAIVIYGSNEIIQMVQIKDTKTTNVELPIRVNVKGVYNFSTNIIGFVRLKAESNDIGTQAENSLLYLILVIIDFIVVIFMFARMICVYLLAMFGCFISAIYALNLDGKTEVMSLNTWARWFIINASIPVLIAIIYRITLECAI